MSALTKEQIEEFTHLPYDPANANWYARQVKILCDMALRSLSAPSAIGDTVAVPRELVDFLLGIRDLDGVGFGENHPTLKGRYWWRHKLAAALAAPAAQSEAREPVARKWEGYCSPEVEKAVDEIESIFCGYKDPKARDWGLMCAMANMIVEYRKIVSATQTPPMEERRTGYYIACFEHSPTGHVTWWAPDSKGYTPDLETAGIYEDVSWLRREGDVPVPVAFIDTLRVRRMVDTGDSLNGCMHSAEKLRAACSQFMNNGTPK